MLIIDKSNLHLSNQVRSLSRTSTNDLNQTLKSNSDSSESRSPRPQFASIQQHTNVYIPPSSTNTTNIQYSHSSIDETDKSSENFESSIEGDYYEENDDNTKRHLSESSNIVNACLAISTFECKQKKKKQNSIG